MPRPYRAKGAPCEPPQHAPRNSEVDVEVNIREIREDPEQAAPAALRRRTQLPEPFIYSMLSQRLSMPFLYSMLTDASLSQNFSWVVGQVWLECGRQAALPLLHQIGAYARQQKINIEWFEERLGANRARVYLELCESAGAARPSFTGEGDNLDQAVIYAVINACNALNKRLPETPWSVQNAAGQHPHLHLHLQAASPAALGAPSPTHYQRAPAGLLPSGGPPSGGLPSGGPPFGGLPSGGPPFGGPPFGGLPFGGPPSGGSPFGGPPSGGSPFGGPPSGGSPFGGPPSGGSPLDSDRHEAAKSPILTKIYPAF